MKIEINIDENATDVSVKLTCNQMTEQITKLIATLTMMNKQLAVKKEDETYLLEVADIIYIEAVERKCFVYTKSDVYESDLKLYEMEQQLEQFGFFRISKSVLLKLTCIQSLKADINRRIKITLTNGEKIMVSRQYAEELKKKLGVK